MSENPYSDSSQSEQPKGEVGAAAEGLETKELTDTAVDLIITTAHHVPGILARAPMPDFEVAHEERPDWVAPTLGAAESRLAAEANPSDPGG